jgi:hypothetical protein
MASWPRINYVPTLHKGFCTNRHFIAYLWSKKFRYQYSISVNPQYSVDVLFCLLLKGYNKGKKECFVEEIGYYKLKNIKWEKYAKEGRKRMGLSKKPIRTGGRLWKNIIGFFSSPMMDRSKAWKNWFKQQLCTCNPNCLLGKLFPFYTTIFAFLSNEFENRESNIFWKMSLNP